MTGGKLPPSPREAIRRTSTRQPPEVGTAGETATAIKDLERSSMTVTSAGRREISPVRLYTEGTLLMRHACLFLSFFLMLSLTSCGPRPRSGKSFDEICRLVSGRSATEVETLLGKPDTRQNLEIGDQRWIWWDFTSLAGESYAPELRGKVVHLEITFSDPAGNLSPGQWKVTGPFAVSYILPPDRR